MIARDFEQSQGNSQKFTEKLDEEVTTRPTSTWVRLLLWTTSTVVHNKNDNQNINETRQGGHSPASVISVHSWNDFVCTPASIEINDIYTCLRQ